jgi:long-chain acyl-CoA synthetase
MQRYSCSDAKPGSVGKGIPGVLLRVLGPAGEPVAPGETGEIVAEGPNVMRGYWREPEATARCLRGGRLHTGDLATVDAEGFLYIVDREKDILKCGGVRVSCRQIEDELAECDSLLEAAVVGVPDDVLGERVKAFVVAREPTCKGPCRREECRGIVGRVDRFCRERLHRNLVPREIVLMPALPRNSAGKVARRELKAQ